MILYNEIDPKASQWLRNLIAAGHIAPGEVLEGSIATLADLPAHTQAHFFAGIGVWSYALRLAGWPDDVPVWTGSCPCQPFSSAGKRKGTSDERHLWPTWFNLIAKHRPPVVFGEQVASKDGLAWLDAVQADLERAGYAFGAADLCAAGVGAPHIRQRLYFVGLRVADAHHYGLGKLRSARLPQDRDAPHRNDADRRGAHGGLGDADRDRAGRDGPWSSVKWLPCRDGKSRPIEPGIEPLVDGAPSRVVKLRAYGNAICAPLAATFIEAVIESL